jgi:peptide/nickel transport system substrate-binding protein
MTLLLLLAAMVACKSNSDSSGETSPKVTAAPPQPQKGGHAKLASNEPDTLNPVIQRRSHRANLLIFEGLVGFDGSLKPVPLLAESWNQSDDGKTITFRLRKGVLWSDGQPFTAKDVAFTVAMIRDTETASPWQTYFSDIDSIDTPDDLTVVVNYKNPYAPALVTWSVGILPKHKFEGVDFLDAPANSEPVGTGPFKLMRWERGTRMLLSRNDKWWHGSTELDTIELVFGITDKLAALKSGDIDFAAIPDIGQWNSESQLPDFLDRFERTSRVESIFRLIAWNGDKAPFDNAKVRQALTHALDRGRIIEDIFLGEGQQLSAPFFANMFGADSQIRPRSFDLELAGKLLDEAGQPLKDGKRFSIDLVSSISQKIPINAEMFAIFKRDLDSLGIDLNVRYLDRANFSSETAQGNYEAVFFGWLPDIPDPDPSALLHSAQIQGRTNYARYANEEVDTWLKEAVGTPDLEKRKAIYKRLHAKLYEDTPYTMLYAPFSHYAWSRKLQRVNPADVSAPTRFPGISLWRFRTTE